MHITIKYFAVLAEQAGKTEESLDIAGTSISELFETLRRKYNFSYDFDDVRVAINTEYVDKDRAVKDGDIIVFITPVAGG